ncbi:MAG: hypothetical protein DIZ80_09640 [endosymbiont of Galathealinum brachiosum]|uniref:ABC transporter domain-containing protein n=1 Tax=endosymbiont of Galathealinum brachiosum TaxID=2200906 RepID=A0A370DCA9_9GAMM|nr:MAG: hypothetical protein DIZ80_09640 [endosymbiont of Galathealinum brachiosum]
MVHLLNIKKLHFLHCGPISLQLKETEISGLSGASGSGKSRLLRALADLDDHSGDIILDDINQQSIDAHLWRQKIVLLSAETSWWFDTVGEHFSVYSESILRKQLVLLGFSDDCLHWSVARLSSGEKQRLGLLRLLQNQPDVLLLDEPTANLDRNNTELFEKFVIDYLHTRSACAIWISHDHDQLQRVCQNKYVLENGVLVDVD